MLLQQKLNRLLFVCSCSNSYCNNLRNIYLNNYFNLVVYYLVCLLSFNFNFNSKSFCFNYLRKNLLLL